MVRHKIMYRFIDHGSHSYLSLSIQLFQRLCHNWRQVPSPNKAVTCVLQINIAFCPNQLNYIELRRFTSTQWTLVKCPHFYATCYFSFKAFKKSNIWSNWHSYIELSPVSTGQSDSIQVKLQRISVNSCQFRCTGQPSGNLTVTDWTYTGCCLGNWPEEKCSWPTSTWFFSP